MQTFLPYPSFTESAKCLDNKRLGKQRVECLQILQTLQKMRDNPNTKIAWMNHPIVKMWRNHECTLLSYGFKICEEWQSRGFKDGVLIQLRRMAMHYSLANLLGEYDAPFIGNKAFHLSHQSNLLRKDFNHYSKYFKDVPDNLPYQWYNPETKLFYTLNQKEQS